MQAGRAAAVGGDLAPAGVEVDADAAAAEVFGHAAGGAGAEAISQLTAIPL